jgi:hypothetical protein
VIETTRQTVTIPFGPENMDMTISFVKKRLLVALATVCVVFGVVSSANADWFPGYSVSSNFGADYVGAAEKDLAVTYPLEPPATMVGKCNTTSSDNRPNSACARTRHLSESLDRPLFGRPTGSRGHVMLGSR